MNTRVITGIALLLAAISSAHAQELVISNARLIDGTGAEPRDGVNIVVTAGRIESIGSGDVDATGAVVIDAGGKTVMPGLSELHVHSSLQFLTDEVEEMDPDTMLTSDEDMQRFMKETFPPRMMKFLDTGVTTIVDPGAYFPYIIELRDSVRSGKVLGPNMYVTGRLFTGPDGHPGSTVCSSHPWCVEHITVSTDDIDVAIEGARMLVAGGVDGLKLVYDDATDEEPGKGHLRKDVMEAIVQEGHRLGVKVLAHTFYIEDTRDVVKAGIDGLVHSTELEDGSYETSDGEYLPDLLVQHDVPMTTTIRLDIDFINSLPEDERAEELAWDANIGPSLRAMSDAGVVLMFGTDFEGIGLDPSPRKLIIDEINTLKRGGFSNAEIIEMATGNAAKHPLTPEDMGTIEVGKIADILVVDGDPLEDIETMTWPQVVILGGKIAVDKR